MTDLVFLPLMYDLVLYRDYRLVNWDCTLLTAISDIEVNKAYYIVYTVQFDSTPMTKINFIKNAVFSGGSSRA